MLQKRQYWNCGQTGDNARTCDPNAVKCIRLGPFTWVRAVPQSALWTGWPGKFHSHITTSYGLR